MTQHERYVLFAMYETLFHDGAYQEAMDIAAPLAYGTQELSKPDRLLWGALYWRAAAEYHARRARPWWRKVTERVVNLWWAARVWPTAEEWIARYPR